MVTIEMVKRSLPSRPRKAVVFWAFIALLIGGAGFAFWMVMKFVPSFMASWSDITWTMMGINYNLRGFLLDFGLPLGQFVTFFIAWVLCNVIVNYRFFYFLFSLPSTLAAVVLIVAGILLIAQPLHQYIPSNAKIIPLVEKGFQYGCMGYAAFMLLFCFIALFYNHTHPPKYNRIYKLRKMRIRLSKSWSEKRRVRKLFYYYYKKGRCKELIGLLVEPYLPVDSELELIPEAIYYMKLAGGDANAEIKGVEIEAALASGGPKAARELYARTLQELEMARNGDLSFLNRGSGDTKIEYVTNSPTVIIKKVPVYMKRRKKRKKVDNRPIDDPLWSPDEIQ